MVAVAHLVRAPLCGSGGSRFKSGQPPITGLSDINCLNCAMLSAFLEVRIYLHVFGYVLGVLEVLYQESDLTTRGSS